MGFQAVGGDIILRSFYVVSVRCYRFQETAEYSKLTENGKALRDAKMKLAQRMLVKLGYSKEEAKKKTDNALAFDKKLSVSIPTMEEQKSEEYLASSNNHYTREELKEAEGNLPILEELENRGYPEQDDYVVSSPDWLKTLNELYTEDNLELMRDLIIVHGVISNSDRLDRECFDWSNACSNEIDGVEESQPDDVYFAQAVAGMLKWPVARLYAEAYLKAEDPSSVFLLPSVRFGAFRTGSATSLYTINYTHSWRNVPYGC